MYKLKNISTPRELLKTVNNMVFQYSVMPSADVLQERVIQYIGDNTDDFKTGYFYASSDKGGTWHWEVVSGGTGGGGDSDETIEQNGVTISLDESGMYLHMITEDIMVYLAQGFLVDFNEEGGFVESEGNAAIVVWVGDNTRVLKDFQISFNGYSYSLNDDWVSMADEGIHYINLYDTTFVEVPNDIIADISITFGVGISIDDILGLREELNSKIKSDELDQTIYVPVYILDTEGEFEETMISLDELKNIGERGEFVTKAALDKRLTEIMNIINGV